MTSLPVRDPDQSTRFIGCCGAYCGTCPALRDNACKGCRIGYDTGEREIAKARCAVKVCCVRNRGLATCADCPDYPGCGMVGAFHRKRGYKYGRYRASVEFIREHGYASFLECADRWTRPYGRL